jgi:DNA mismatch endonuclease (patch repair protein)
MSPARWRYSPESRQRPLLMTDTLTRKERSFRMSCVKSRDTSPERVVRRMIHAMGFRYRLHEGGLPGRPDIVLPRHRKIVFVNGCFWHRHSAAGCKLSRLPKSRLEFWLPKLESNRLRDQRDMRRLRNAGWKILVVWECQLRHKERIENKLRFFLGERNAGG